MNFELTERQKKLVKAFRLLGETWFTRDHIAQWERNQGVSDDAALAFVEEYSRHDELMPEHSVGGSLFAQTLIAEEIARSSGALLPFANDIMNLRIMEEYAETGQFGDILESYRRTGRLAFAFAITEPEGGSDMMSMRTAVTRRGNQLVLAGSKTFVVNGEYAPSIVVAAIDKEAKAEKYPALSFWLLPRDLPGISAWPINKIGQEMLPFSQVVFDEVAVQEEFRLKNGVQHGFPQLFHLLEIGRINVCASSLGMAQAAMEDAVCYAKTRAAFGKPIFSFQNLSEMIVDMEVRLHAMRHLIYSAAWSIDKRHPDRRLKVALMKRYVPAVATEIASNALQIFGGLGYTKDVRVSRIWQDCRGNQIAEGTDQVMVLAASPLIADKYSSRDV